MRIGHGYDVHRLEADRKFILGGVQIDWPVGLQGHSDADVLTHAIIDALLGAAALGDIGQHFPDNDDAYRDADSIELLKITAEKLRAAGYEPVNIDATVICQLPKLRPYIDDIRRCLAQALCMETGRISVKATTEEGLGFTGIGLGVSAHAVCLISETT